MYFLGLYGQFFFDTIGFSRKGNKCNQKGNTQTEMGKLR